MRDRCEPVREPVHQPTVSVGQLKGGETVVLGRFSLLLHLPRGFADYLARRIASASSVSVGAKG